MDIIFSRKFGDSEFRIIIGRGNYTSECSLSVIGADNEDVITSQCIVVNETLQYFNTFSGFERDSFYRLFETADVNLLNICRVIGITNSLGHFFEVFSNKKVLDEFLVKSFKDLRDFAFVDWQAVSDHDDNQLIYVTDYLLDEHSKDASKLYEDGYIGKISLIQKGIEPIVSHWIESKDIDGSFDGLTDIRKTLISNINSFMREHFKG